MWPQVGEPGLSATAEGHPFSGRVFVGQPTQEDVGARCGRLSQLVVVLRICFPIRVPSWDFLLRFPNRSNKSVHEDTDINDNNLFVAITIAVHGLATSNMAIAIEELEQLPTRQRLRVTADFDHAAGTLRDPRTARLLEERARGAGI